MRRRFREIGIRMSLGARPGEIRRMILRRRMGIAALGLAAGGVVAWGLGRWLDSLLYQVSPADPLTWLGVLAVVGASAGAAAWFPSRLATTVDPREVLAQE